MIISTHIAYPSYKFRAECISDVIRLMKRIINHDPIEFISIEKMECGTDVVCTLSCGLSLEGIRLAMERVRDSHVMIETLETAENYTGNRIFNL